MTSRLQLYQCDDNDERFHQRIGETICRKLLPVPLFFQGTVFYTIPLIMSIYLFVNMFRIDHIMHRERFITDADFQKKYNSSRAVFTACSNLLFCGAYVLFMMVLLFIFEKFRNEYFASWFFKNLLSAYNDGHTMRFVIMILSVILFLVMLSFVLNFWQKHQVPSGYTQAFIASLILALILLVPFVMLTVYRTCFFVYNEEGGKWQARNPLCKENDWDRELS